MKVIGKIKILCVVLLTAGWTMAQNNTPQSFLNELPPLPDNFCGASDDAILRWNDRILALGNKMKELYFTEKSAQEEFQAAAKPNLAIFEPSNEEMRERLQKILEESEALSEKANSLLNELITIYSEKKGEVTNKHSLILDPLRQQKGEAIGQGKNTSVIDKKIYAAEMEECKELAVVHSEFLVNYRSNLDVLVEYGIRANKLQDESNGMIYTSYTFKTKYGFWMGSIMAYADELTHIFDNIPLKNSDRENI